MNLAPDTCKVLPGGHAAGNRYRPDNPYSRPWNPLADDPVAAGLSSYLGRVDGQIRTVLQQGVAPPARASAVAEAMEGKILDRGFPCVAARSAFNRHDYRLGLYPALGTPDSARAICHDLYEFGHEMAEGMGDRFTTFIAAFDTPAIQDEAHFERLLWQQLQAMHEVDVRHFDWDPSVSADPGHADFSFSIGGRAYFIVGLHPLASRFARVAPQPCIVFNLHAQFDRLREQGKYDGLQRAIRARDLALQGSLNPALSTFGEAPESRQYAGRAVSSQWRCPFQSLARPPSSDAT